MPITRKSGERIPIVPGDHVLVLREVKEIESDNPFDKPEDGSAPQKRMRWAWVFHSERTDEDGVPYEYTEWTGPFYGDSRAKLTWLYGMIVPDLSEEERSSLNTDTLIGRRYKTKIQMVKNQKGVSVPKCGLVPATESGVGHAILCRGRAPASHRKTWEAEVEERLSRAKAISEDDLAALHSEIAALDGAKEHICACPKCGLTLTVPCAGEIVADVKVGRDMGGLP